MNKLKRFLISDNMIIAYIIFIFSAVVAVKEPAFLGVATVVNLLRECILTLCFVLCEMMIMITGGIDVSFPSIACVSMYVPMYLFNNGLIADSGLLFLLIALAIGLIFGLLNGLLVARLRIPSLIATLATGTIATGGLAIMLGVKAYSRVPIVFEKIYNMNLFTYTDKAIGLSYPMTVLIFVPIALCIIIAIVLKYTMLGRGLYALGGNMVAARIVGFPVLRLQTITYAFSGIIASLASVLYVILMKSVSTNAFSGCEMLVIAACVVGGCSLTGGYGGVIGAVLGTILITLVQNNLNMLGIDTKWQTFAVGIVLLLGVLVTAIKGKIRIKKKGWGRL